MHCVCVCGGDIVPHVMLLLHLCAICGTASAFTMVKCKICKGHLGVLEVRSSGDTNAEPSAKDVLHLYESVDAATWNLDAHNSGGICILMHALATFLQMARSKRKQLKAFGTFTIFAWSTHIQD